MKHKKTLKPDQKRDEAHHARHVLDHEEKRPIKNWTKIYTEYEPYAEDLEVFYAK